MIRLELDPSASQSFADQVAIAIRGAVASGELEPGDPLPPARDLAAATGVNLHTILRGYHQLRDEGLIELRRGRGARIRSDATAARTAYETALRAAADAAGSLGVSPDDAANALRALMTR